jgi:chemotaxis protein methyltransferase CheR
MELLRESNPSGVGSQFTLTDRDFDRFRQFILTKTGITLADNKRQLLISRLSRRLRALNLDSFGAYYDYVLERDPSGTEKIALLNCITTNKTDFFREAHHFDLLREQILPEVAKRAQRTGENKLRIWCAASSTGEEPYSIAISVLEALGPKSKLDVKILASDIDTDVLAKAEAGIYPADRLGPIPQEFVRKWFLRGKGKFEGHFRVRPEVQKLLTFRRVNLIEERWPMRGPFDVIFCRNVIIYFSRETQATLFTHMKDLLHPEGWLILGHSESLHWMPQTYVAAGPTAYRLKRGAPSDESVPPTNTSRDISAPRPSVSEPRPPTAIFGVPSESTGRRATDSSTASPSTPRFSAFSASPTPPSTASASAASAPAVRRHVVPEETLANVSIHIGGVHASRTPCLIRTVLGSCISVCLYDQEARIGGMNHFMLPDGAEDESTPTRFGVNAMEVLINEVMKLGGERPRLRAKVFGGGHVMRVETYALGIGERNIAFVKEFLDTERIVVTSQRLGGTQPVQVHFYTHTGQARIKTLGQDFIGDLVQDELRFRLKVSQFSESPQSGDVTLF